MFPIYPEPLAAMVASGGLGLADLGTPTITPASDPTSNFPAQIDPRAPGNVAFNQVYGGTAQDNQSPNPGTHVDDRLFQDLVVGLQGLNVDAVPSSYSDWTVTILWNDPNHPLYATLGEGLPYAYFMRTTVAASWTFRRRHHCRSSQRSRPSMRAANPPPAASARSV